MNPDSHGRPGQATAFEARRSGPGPGLDAAAAGWSPAYLRCREIEGRLYPDPIVATLPRVPQSDPHAAEWRLRALSSTRLLDRLARQSGPPTVLEVGCGNGWLANLLSSVEGSHVTGVDVNEVELAQARRVFGGRSNLRFVLADITLAEIPIGDPTVIVLASVAQYIADLAGLLRRLRSWLPASGELHILDTPFYAPGELEAARERSRRHYADLHVPEMADVYRHHPWHVLDEFHPELLYQPGSIRARTARRLGRPSSPFPWIRIGGIR